MFLAVVPPDEHEVLVLLCEIVALLGTAKLLGWLVSRVGQPAVIGELVAGLVLGPSFLGRVAPGVHDWLFPADAVQGAALYGLAWLGLLLLLATTGFESDLRVVASLGRPAIAVAAGSLAVPLVGGAVIGPLIPETLRGPEATATTFAAFLAVALSISSLPVVAKVLAELGLVRRNIGQLILAVAMTNDVIGWVLLGIVAGLAQAGEVDAGALAVRLAAIALFLGAALTLGQRLLDRALRASSDTAAPPSGQAALVVLVVIASGALTQWMGVEAVLGAFVAGILVGRSRWRDERVVRLVDDFGSGLLAPLFFATAGLRVDLAVFADPDVALWSVVVVAVATVTKFAGTLLGATVGGLPRREQLAAGVGLNARGALEIVIASVGVGIGVLNDESYGVIVVMAIATSLAAPPLLRLLLADWEGSPDEQERLERERVEHGRLVLSSRPPLLLSRGNPPSVLAAQITALSWPADTPVTALVSSSTPVTAPPSDGPAAPTVARVVLGDVLDGRQLEVVDLADGADPAEAVLTRASRGHGAIVLGITDRPGDPGLPPLARAVVERATVPVLLVRGERMTGQRLPAAFERAVVPVVGTTASAAATEVAAHLSAQLGTHLTLVHVDDSLHLPFAHLDDESSQTPGDAVLDLAATTARHFGARGLTTLSRGAESLTAEVLGLTVELDADLLVVGATRRQGNGSAMLGPVAGQALATSATTVVVVVVPPGWTGANVH